MPAPLLPPRPGPLDLIVGAVRFSTVLACIVLGSIVMLGARLVPVRVRGVGLPVWVAVALCRLFLRVTGVRLDVEDAEIIRAHRGFVFFNHLTFIDGLVLMAIAPVRFLSMAEVRWIPFVGAMARSVGTIFVRRNRPRSRAAAREALREAIDGAPLPIALAPEGRIGPGPGVLPLRRGSFRVAAEAEAPILLVAMHFSPLAYGRWHEAEWPTRPLWRLCARTTPFSAHVRPLLPVLDSTTVPARELTGQAEARFNEALGVESSFAS